MIKDLLGKVANSKFATNYGSGGLTTAGVSAAVGGVLSVVSGGPLIVGAFAGFTTGSVIRRAAPYLHQLSQETGVLSKYTVDRRLAMLAGAGLSGLSTPRKRLETNRLNRGRGAVI